MKRLLWIGILLLLGNVACRAAMSNGQMRTEVRFLTDKMAYELNLSTAQYNDVYEINYDFLFGVNSVMDAVVRGEAWALDRYYDRLDLRNDDLRWVLDSRQYTRFLRTLYFYRPLYVSDGRWQFRVYITYSNHSHFYFPLPAVCRAYRGAHARPAPDRPSFYRGRYDHPHYEGLYRIRDPRHYRSARQSDFGPVRPAAGRPSPARPSRPAARPDAGRGDRPAQRGPERPSRGKAEKTPGRRGQGAVRGASDTERRTDDRKAPERKCPMRGDDRK